MRRAPRLRVGKKTPARRPAPRGQPGGAPRARPARTRPAGHRGTCPGLRPDREWDRYWRQARTSLRRAQGAPRRRARRPPQGARSTTSSTELSPRCASNRRWSTRSMVTKLEVVSVRCVEGDERAGPDGGTSIAHRDDAVEVQAPDRLDPRRIVRAREAPQVVSKRSLPVVQGGAPERALDVSREHAHRLGVGERGPVGRRDGEKPCPPVRDALRGEELGARAGPLRERPVAGEHPGRDQDPLAPELLIIEPPKVEVDLRARARDRPLDPPLDGAFGAPGSGDQRIDIQGGPARGLEQIDAFDRVGLDAAVAPRIDPNRVLERTAGEIEGCARGGPQVDDRHAVDREGPVELVVAQREPAIEVKEKSAPRRPSRAKRPRRSGTSPRS